MPSTTTVKVAIEVHENIQNTECISFSSIEESNGYLYQNQLEDPKVYALWLNDMYPESVSNIPMWLQTIIKKNKLIMLNDIMSKFSIIIYMTQLSIKTLDFFRKYEY